MITKSKSPDVRIPDVPITEYVLRHAGRLGDKPALIDGRRPAWPGGDSGKATSSRSTAPTCPSTR